MGFRVIQARSARHTERNWPVAAAPQEPAPNRPLSEGVQPSTLRPSPPPGHPGPVAPPSPHQLCV